MKSEIILFETRDKEISIPVSFEKETVWLSANQMALLFDRDEKTIRKHINNVFSDGELSKENNTQKMRVECRFNVGLKLFEELGIKDILAVKLYYCQYIILKVDK